MSLTSVRRAACVALVVGFAAVVSAQERPFGTLREQAAMQQQWLKKRLVRRAIELLDRRREVPGRLAEYLDLLGGAFPRCPKHEPRLDRPVPGVPLEAERRVGWPAVAYR